MASVTPSGLKHVFHTNILFLVSILVSIIVISYYMLLLLYVIICYYHI